MKEKILRRFMESGKGSRVRAWDHEPTADFFKAMIFGPETSLCTAGVSRVLERESTVIPIGQRHERRDIVGTRFDLWMWYSLCLYNLYKTRRTILFFAVVTLPVQYLDLTNILMSRAVSDRRGIFGPRLIPLICEMWVSVEKVRVEVQLLCCSPQTGRI